MFRIRTVDEQANLTHAATRGAHWNSDGLDSFHSPSGFLLTWVVVLFIPEHADRLAAEKAPLVKAILLFTLAAAAAGWSFYGEIRQRRWRFPAHAAMVAMLGVACMDVLAALATGCSRAAPASGAASGKVRARVSVTLRLALSTRSPDDGAAEGVVRVRSHVSACAADILVQQGQCDASSMVDSSARVVCSRSGPGGLRHCWSRSCQPVRAMRPQHGALHLDPRSYRFYYRRCEACHSGWRRQVRRGSHIARAGSGQASSAWRTKYHSRAGA